MVDGRAGGEVAELSPDPELFDAVAHCVLVALEDPGQCPYVLGPDRDEAAVEVAPLDLDHPDIAAQDLALWGVQAF